MFHADQDGAKWASEVGLEHVEALSPRAHIHLFRVSGETTSAQDWAVLRTLRNDDRVEAAQFNHTVQNRETLPNDPQIGQQWHHVENGDHDIDSDLAWDITVGGAAADDGAGPGLDESAAAGVTDGAENGTAAVFLGAMASTLARGLWLL